MIKKLGSLLIILSIIVSFFSLTNNVRAQVDFGGLESVAAPKFAGGTIGSVVTSMVGYIFPLAGFALLIYLVYGGYTILTSQSVPEKMSKGGSIITSAIVGFIILFLAYWIVQFVGRILGIQAISAIFG